MAAVVHKNESDNKVALFANLYRIVLFFYNTLYNQPIL